MERSLRQPATIEFTSATVGMSGKAVNTTEYEYLIEKTLRTANLRIQDLSNTETPRPPTQNPKSTQKMKVAVAGGTTSVGRAIVDGLKARGKFECTILSRKPHANLSVLVIDYDDIDGLAAKLQEAEVCVSTLSIGDDASGQAQLNLIEAANRSKCTRRFLSSECSIQYTPE